MGVTSIGGSLALLLSAVKPVQPAQPTLGNPGPSSGSGASNVNTFALETYTAVLEAQESLLNPSGSSTNGTSTVNEVVGAATAASNAQQAVAVYQANQLVVARSFIAPAVGTTV